jgi:hypothetical protein
MVAESPFLSHARPGSLHIFGGQKSSSSHACSCTPSFLRTLKQVLKSIIWLLNIRLAFTWEWISFSNCLALLLVIGPAISSVVSFGDQWMLEMSSLGTTDRNEMELHSRWRHSDFRTAAACDGRPDHVCTWIQACKYFLESSWSLLSYALNLKSISCRSWPQSLFWCRDLFLPTVLRHLILAHWVVYHIESNLDTS